MKDIVIDGRTVRELRDNLRLTQGQLALKSGVGQAHISQLESGSRRNAHISTVVKLAQALRVEVEDLISNSPQDATEDLPPLHIYVRRKFRDNPALCKALIATYEAVVR